MKVRGVFDGLESEHGLTRPVVRGRRIVVSCGHYLAAVAGMRTFERGGNAIDAGVAMVFAQSVLEPQAFGFGGEAPILIHSAQERRVVAINGNTRAPKAASIEWFKQRGIPLIPGDGFLPAGVCAVADALITALEVYGRLTLGDVIAPAIELVSDGFPMYEAMRHAIVKHETRFRTEWPSSANLLLPDGRVPEVGERWRNLDLARTFERLVEAEYNARSGGRAAALRAARDRFYKGEIAAEIVSFQREVLVRDANGVESAGLLVEDDFASYRARIEEPVRSRYRGYDVYKCGPWSQGPVLLQQLNILEGYDLAALGHNSLDYIHLLTEAGKLAFADREEYYGDPDFVEVPLTGLLSKAYAVERRKLIDPDHASLELRPGNPYPFQGSDVSRVPRMRGQKWEGGTTGTRAVDADGNMFSATPSGGWFPSSPVIPGLGFCLGTRGQSFWLKEGHPAALHPMKQPRTTLSPSLVMKNGQPHMVFGTPGDDQQDQWGLQFFLNVVDFGMDVQSAIDAPNFHSNHFPSSFYPRESNSGEVVLEDRISPTVITQLGLRGHVPRVVSGWCLNFTTAIIFRPEGRAIEGGASSRWERNYALGW